MDYVLGVDLGTTFTAAATWSDGVAVPVTLGEHADAVPSVVCLREDGTLLVGDAADRRAAADPTRVAREFKRRMGDEQTPFLLADEPFTAVELTGQLLTSVLQRVVEREGAEPAHVVLTHPAGWGEHRRSLLTDAAGAAGLTSVGLMPEPVAAATYYTSRQRLPTGAAVAVYDFGGGTFDCAVVQKTTDGFEILGDGLGGDDRLGGGHFDFEILRMVLEAAGIEHPDGDDPAERTAAAQLRKEAAQAKLTLSADVRVDVPVVFPGHHTQVRITRDQFEEAIRHRVLHTVHELQRTVALAGVAERDLHGVLLIGGSSRIPLVARLIAREMGVPTLADAPPKQAVCLGAAIAGAVRIAPPARSTAPSTAPPASPPSPPTASPPGPLPTPEEHTQSAPVPEGGVLVTPEDRGISRPLDVRTTPRVTRPRRTRVVSPAPEPVVVRLAEAPLRPHRIGYVVAAVVLALVLVTLLSIVVAPR